MARRKQTTWLDDYVEMMEIIFRHVPPWLSIPIAAGAYFGISMWVNGKFKTPGNEWAGQLLGGALAGAVLVGGVQGWLHRRKAAAFMRQNITLEWVNGLSWQEFERMAGELFSARGYSVELLGGGGADGGVDLRLTRDGETTLVQCKRWKVFKVGVKPIREFYGVMASEGVDHGIFATSGVYTKEALAFADGKPLVLIDGAQLASMAKAVQEGRLAKQAPTPTPKPLAKPPEPSGRAAEPDSPSCPACGKPMLRRRAKSGKSSGQEFWGCQAFPQCRGTRPLAGVHSASIANGPQWP